MAKLFHLKPTKLVPNSVYPLMYYQSAFSAGTSPDAISAHFAKHRWDEQYRGGMSYQSHYHSTTHEVMGVYKGKAQLQFGMSDQDTELEQRNKVVLEVSEGDVIIIPSGVAHRCLKDDGGLSTVGSYPRGGKQWDMNYGGEGGQIEVSVPDMDPFYGRDKEGLTGVWVPESQ